MQNHNIPVYVTAVQLNLTHYLHCEPFLMLLKVMIRLKLLKHSRTKAKLQKLFNNVCTSAYYGLPIEFITFISRYRFNAQISDLSLLSAETGVHVI